MSGTFRGAVNGHLRKASALLEQCQTQQSEGGSRLTQDALIEGCCFHLQLAKINFLREIADNYQIADAALISDTSELASALSAADKFPAELSEIQTSQQEGWLKAMDSAYNQLLAFKGSAAKSAPAVQTAGLIQTRELANTDLDFSSVQVWTNNLKELVERQREMMVEC